MTVNYVWVSKGPSINQAFDIIIKGSGCIHKGNTWVKTPEEGVKWIKSWLILMPISFDKQLTEISRAKHKVSKLIYPSCLKTVGSERSTGIRHYIVFMHLMHLCSYQLINVSSFIKMFNLPLKIPLKTYILYGVLIWLKEIPTPGVNVITVMASFQGLC